MRQPDSLPTTVDFGLRDDGARPERTSLVRAINEQVVLDAVLSQGTVTRSELSRYTGLSKPTISSLVKTLEQHGLVTARGPTQGVVGRPATVYSVNRLAGHTYAVDLGGTTLRAAVTDVFGEILSETTIPTPQDDAEALLDTIVSVYDELLAEGGVERGGVAAICIGIPGVVQSGGHHIESAFNLPFLGDTDIPQEIERRTALRVITENDVNLAAIGERWRGGARNTRNFAAISIGTGIGMGIVLDGELYRGRGAAGEIGFFPIGSDPFDPEVKERGGALERAAASKGIHAHMVSILNEYPLTVLNAESTVRDIFAAAETGDPLGRAVIAKVARLVALAIAGVSSVLDPPLIILGGGIGANPLLADLVRGLVTEVLPSSPNIATSALADRASLCGAIALALSRIRRDLLGSRGSTRREGRLDDASD